MVTHIYPSSSDFENLSALRTEASQEANVFDYSGVVVPKPWGEEYLWFQNSSVAIWMLHLKLGCGTSLHCHARKRTSLVVIQGNILCSTIDDRYLLKEGEAVVLEPCVFHSSTAISENDVFLMEVETPPLKGDLLRFRDAFGRAGKAYESSSQYSRELEKYDYQPLESIRHGGASFGFKEMTLRYSSFKGKLDFQNGLIPGGISIPLLGRLVFGKQIVADAGEAVASSEIPLESCPESIPPVELLQIISPTHLNS